MNTKALEAFVRKAATIREHCTHIMASLDEYQAQPDGIDWAYVGSAGYVEERLAEIAAFLDGSAD